MVKRGAFDFCEKPFPTTPLVDRIEQRCASRPRCWPRARQGAADAAGDLTERERDVMRLVVEACPTS
jgi:two-component system response regulator DctR